MCQLSADQAILIALFFSVTYLFSLIQIMDLNILQKSPAQKNGCFCTPLSTHKLLGTPIFRRHLFHYAMDPLSILWEFDLFWCFSLLNLKIYK